MEKIYMHDNENNSKRKQAKKKRSVASSVIISMVAVFALIIVGFSQISFAIPEEETLGEGFTSVDPATYSDKRTIGNAYGFNVPLLYTSSGDLVFCIERDIPYLGGLDYKIGDSIRNDAGLMYILANVYPNESFASDLSLEARNWLSQSAIWIYVAGCVPDANAEHGYSCSYPYANNNEGITPEVVKGIYNENKLYLFGAAAGTYVAEVTSEDIASGITTLYQKYDVDDILTRANQLRGSYSSKVNVKRNTSVISLTTDGKYYQTDYVIVDGIVPDEAIGKFNGYEVTLDKVPEGTILIDKDGNEIKDFTNLSPGTTFALRIPVANVTDDNKNVEIGIIGSFDTYFANKYIYTGSQTVVSFKKINNNVSVPYEIDVNYAPRVPDTASSNTSMWFFVGIILLLSGLGIFYTSAKKN